MKIENYTAENGYINVTLKNDEEEQLCFRNPNIYNYGKWEIQSYVKRNNGEEEFNVITARGGKKFYLIHYTAKDYSRLIQCSLKNKVLAEVIKSNANDKVYYPDPKILCSTNLDKYIKQDIIYYDEKDNIFYCDLNKSSKALSDYLEYSKKYSKILSKMEKLFKMNLEQLNDKQLNKTK